MTIDKIRDWARRINDAGKAVGNDGKPFHEHTSTIVGLSALILEATTPGQSWPPPPKATGWYVTVMATELAQAVAADERGDGCDIAAGLYGSAVSALLRKWADEFAQAAAPPKVQPPGGDCEPGKRVDRFDPDTDAYSSDMAQCDDGAYVRHSDYAALEAKLAERDALVARLSETWMDERGTTWIPPTAYAYACVCRARWLAVARAEAAAAKLTERDVELTRIDRENREGWKQATHWRQKAEAAERAGDEARFEIERLTAVINTPQADDFLRAVSIEAEHQRQRWGSKYDAGKTAADWFWLIGYLAGKALHSATYGDDAKAEHHIITTAAACANWHKAVKSETDMRPETDGAAMMTRGDG